MLHVSARPYLFFNVVTSCLFPTFYHPFSSLSPCSVFFFHYPLPLPLSQLAPALFSFCLLIASFSIKVLANTQPCCPPAYTIPFVSLKFQQAVFSPFENGHNYLSALGSLCLSHCVSLLRISLKLHKLITWDALQDITGSASALLVQHWSGITSLMSVPLFWVYMERSFSVLT